MGIDGFKRPVNAAKTGYTWLISRIARHSVMSGMPVSISTELTNYCNLKCSECSSGSEIMSRARGFMDIDLFKKIILELRPYLYNINLYFQGEPMMHNRFFDFLEFSKGLKVTVSTNGHFLSPDNAEKLTRSGLHKIIISLDGMDQQTYSLYRKGGQFEKVISGINSLSKAIESARSSLKLEVQFLVNRQNEKQISAAKVFAKKAGVTLRLKSMQITDNERLDYWLPENRKFARYKKINGIYKIKSRLGNNCLRLWLNPVITWDGKVVPCCFDKNADYIMGDLNQSSFRSVWNGEKYESFRNTLLKERKSIDICRNCTSGLNGVGY
jgi:radical SAM protein with 4Fe4S-binding SPASM domain